MTAAWVLVVLVAPLALGQLVRAGHRRCGCGRPLRFEVGVTIRRQTET
jgi:hypothetical protein